MPHTFKDIRVVLLDIEGTICPITFVKDTLFPYAIRALPSVLRTKWTDPQFIPYRGAFPPEHRTSPEALQAHVEDLTRRDVKVAYLKNLQGYLWESGYKTGAYTTPLYPDVTRNLQKWTSTNTANDDSNNDGKEPISIAIYSSGSVFAQKLLFAHVRTSTNTPSTNVTNTSTNTSITSTDTNTNTNYTANTTSSSPQTADLNPLILPHGYFDTTNAGPKTHPQSYTTITQTLNLSHQPDQILFLSDSTAEVRAAREAGLNALVVVREGNAPVSDGERRELGVIEGFDEVFLT